jgi:enterochelin esterase-like enzyme
MKQKFHQRASQVFILFVVLMLLTACSPTLAGTPPAPAATAISTRQAEPTSLPTATQTMPAVCSETKGSLVNATLPAAMLKYPLEVKIYLPPCYSAEKAEGYPAVYMLHGMTDTNEQWISLGLTDAADRMITAKTIQPMVLVFPYEVNWQLSPDQSGYGDAIVDVLIPWMEEHYNVCTGRDCRAIGGLSRGGNWAVFIGFNHWQLFNAIGAHSTPLFTGGLTHLRSAIRSLPSPSDAPALTLDVGNKDENLNQVREFEKTLTELHVAHDFHINSGYHDDAYWSSHVEEYLLWYAAHLRKP